MSKQMKVIMENWKRKIQESNASSLINENDEINASTDLFSLDVSTIKDEDLKTALELFEEEMRQLAYELQLAKRARGGEQDAEDARADRAALKPKINAIKKRLQDIANAANATTSTKDDKAAADKTQDAAEKVSNINGETASNDEIESELQPVVQDLDQAAEIVKKAREEEPQERQTITLRNNTPKLQSFANAFVQLSDAQYDQLRQVLDNELEKAKLEQNPWQELPQGLQQFGQNAALFMFDEKGSGYTLDPQITKIIPVKDEDGNPVAFEITKDEFQEQYQANQENMEQIGEKLEEEGEGEMSDDLEKKINAAAQKIKTEGSTDLFQAKDYEQATKALRELGFDKLPEDLSSLNNEELGKVERTVDKLKAEIEETYKTLGGDTTTTDSGEQASKTTEKEANRIYGEIAKRMQGILSNPKFGTQQVKDVKITQFFNSLKEKDFEKYKIAVGNPKVTQGVFDKLTDIVEKFPLSSTKNGASVQDLLDQAKQRLGTQTQDGEPEETEADFPEGTPQEIQNSVLQIFDSIKGEIEEETHVPTKRALSKFLSLYLEATKEPTPVNENNMELALDMNDAFARAYRVLNSDEQKLVATAFNKLDSNTFNEKFKLVNVDLSPEDEEEKEEKSTESIDALLQLDGEQFMTALAKFYRENDLIDKEGIKKSLLTLLNAFKSLPSEASSPTPEPEETDADKAEKETSTTPSVEPKTKPKEKLPFGSKTPFRRPKKDDPKSSDAEPASPYIRTRIPEEDFEYDEDGNAIPPEKFTFVESENFLEGIYLINEEEEQSEVGKAIATLTDVEEIPDTVIPFERVGELRDKLKSILKVKDEQVKSPDAAELTSEDLVEVMAAKSGKDLIRAFLDILKQKFGGNIPKEFEKSIKLVLRKEPDAIVNMIDSPMLKIDVLDGEELAKKIAKFYPPDEELDSGLSAGLNNSQKKVLKAIQSIFAARKIEKIDGDKAQALDTDFQSRFANATDQIAEFDEEVMKSLAISLSRTVGKGVFSESKLNEFVFGQKGREKRRKFQQKYMGGKVKDQATGLEGIMKRVMDREDFINSRGRIFRTFKTPEFRSFYGDLRDLLMNIMQNPEEIKIDDETMDVIIDVDDFDLDDAPEGAGEITIGPGDQDPNTDDEEGTDDGSGELTIGPGDQDPNEDEIPTDVERASETLKKRALRISEQMTGKDLSGLEIFNIKAFVSLLIFFMRQTKAKLQEEEEAKGKILSGKDLEKILSNEKLAAEFVTVDKLFDGSLKQYAVKKYPFLKGVIKDLAKSPGIDLPEPSGSDMKNPEDIDPSQFDDIDATGDRDSKTDEPKEGTKPISLQQALRIVSTRDTKKVFAKSSQNLDTDIKNSRTLLALIVVDTILKNPEKEEKLPFGSKTPFRRPKKDDPESGVEIDYLEEDKVTNRDRNAFLTNVISEIENEDVAQSLKSMMIDIAQKGTKTYPTLHKMYVSTVKILEKTNKQKLISYVNQMIENAEDLKKQGVFYRNSGSLAKLELDVSKIKSFKLEESLKPIIERMLIEHYTGV